MFEKGGAGEVQYPGVTELQVQAQAGDHVDDHRRHQQQHEVVLVEVSGDRQNAEDRQDVQDAVPVGEQPAHMPAGAQAGGNQHDNDSGGQQDRDAGLRFHRQHQDHIDRDRDGGGAAVQNLHSHG